MGTPGKVLSFRSELFNELAHASGFAVIGTGVFALSKIVEEVKDVPGIIVECGTYRGGSAVAMAVTAPDKPVWCFDTFSGMPEVTEFDQHKKGDFTTTYDEVKRAVEPYPNILLIAGEFKNTFPKVMRVPISLLYLDCDLYESYKIALETFWPMVSPGGWLVAEDYMHESCKGAKKACDEFFGEGKLIFRHDFWTVTK